MSIYISVSFENLTTNANGVFLKTAPAIIFVSDTNSNDVISRGD